MDVLEVVLPHVQVPAHQHVVESVLLDVKMGVTRAAKAPVILVVKVRAKLAAKEIAKEDVLGIVRELARDPVGLIAFRVQAVVWVHVWGVVS